jgi:hypothetical protein
VIQLVSVGWSWTAGWSSRTARPRMPSARSCWTRSPLPCLLGMSRCLAGSVPSSDPASAITACCSAGRTADRRWPPTHPNPATAGRARGRRDSPAVSGATMQVGGTLPLVLRGIRGQTVPRAGVQARRGAASPAGRRREAGLPRTVLSVEADTATADTASLPESRRLSSTSNEQNHRGDQENGKDSNPACARTAQGHRDR